MYLVNYYDWLWRFKISSHVLSLSFLVNGLSDGKDQKACFIINFLKCFLYFIISIFLFFLMAKGQLIAKADWRAIDSPKKQTDEFDLFAVKCRKTNKTNASIRFLGESMARQSAFEINWPLPRSWLSYLSGLSCQLYLLSIQWDWNIFEVALEYFI